MEKIKDPFKEIRYMHVNELCCGMFVREDKLSLHSHTNTYTFMCLHTVHNRSGIRAGACVCGQRRGRSSAGHDGDAASSDSRLQHQARCSDCEFVDSLCLLLKIVVSAVL